MNKIFKLLKKKPSESFSAQQIQAERERLKGVVDRGMKKYEKGKRQGRLNPQLKKTMSYNNN